VGAQRIPAPVTVEEWEEIPDPPGGQYELHHGELVLVTRPVRRHWDLRRRVQKMLEPLLEPLGYIVGTEYAYRPFPQNEVWSADVAAIKADRHETVEKWLAGSPELAIEVKSPSNSMSDLKDHAMTTLAGEGGSVFWILDLEQRTVTVYTKGGMYVFRDGQEVPVSPRVDRTRLKVSAIFA
jgi:Uma2 family endonuclease